MELCKKIITLRKQKGWTQEELAEALYVSRAAISKWESGRGYPSIDSLKALSKLFLISIDELLSNEELIAVAETDAKEKSKRTQTIIFGLIDCMLILLLFFPFFNQQIERQYISVSVLHLTDISAYMKILYIALIILSFSWGVIELSLQSVSSRLWQGIKNYISIILNVLSLLCFILGNQPYAGVFLLFILIIKGFIRIKAQ